MKMTIRGATAVGLLLLALLLTGCEEALERTAPSKASGPSPSHNATNVSRDANLNWAEVSGARVYRVYIGTDSSPDTGEFKREQSGTSFDPGTLKYSTPYYWRVDSKNDDGTTTGNVWKFTTAPAPNLKPSNPLPAHDATGVPLNTNLEWSAASGATSYLVYFGADSTPDHSEFKVDQTETTFDPGPLDFDTIYYWRVDSKNEVGTVRGAVWRFRTEAEPPPKPSKATNPIPAHNATGVSRNTNLTWSEVSDATSYLVYVGSATSLGSDELQGEQSVTRFDFERLLKYGTRYCWRVDTKNEGGTTSGEPWCFTTEATPVPKVTGPKPANTATDVDIFADLEWAAAPGATGYDVYIGTVPSPPLRETQSSSSRRYEPGRLDYGTKYYWRIDSKNEGGITRGDVWSFTTVAASASLSFLQ